MLFRSIQDAVEHRTIALAETAHQPILLLLDLAGNEERHRGRNQGERQEKSSGQREDDRDRHRVEGLSFDAFEREDRQIDRGDDDDAEDARSEEHTSELQSLMRISYAVFCLKKKKNTRTIHRNIR